MAAGIQSHPTSNALLWAGVMHDVGKLGHRASHSLNRSELSDAIKHTDITVDCPHNGKYHTHLHVLWSRQLLQLPGADNQPLYKLLEKKLNYRPDLEVDNLVNLAVRHHKPGTFLQRLVTMADTMASSLERQQRDVVQDGNAFRQVGLTPIFQQLNLPKFINGKSQNATNAFTTSASQYIPQVLDVNRQASQWTQQPQQCAIDDWKRLWDEFIKRVVHSRVCEEADLTSMLAIQQQYLWCVPSEGQDMAVISLYHHNRMVGALAHCMHEYFLQNNTCFDTAGDKLQFTGHHAPFVLACLDLSGIQNFIYNISSRRAAKSLKGRSFGLQLLIDGLVWELLQRSDTSQAHVVYQSGGKAFVLLPHTQAMIQMLQSFADEVEQSLFEHYGHQLYCSIGWQAFGYARPIVSMQNDTEDKITELRALMQSDANGAWLELPLSEIWRNVVRKTSERKKRKWRKLITSKYDEFFTPQGVEHNGVLMACATTGTLLGKDKARLDDDDATDVETYIQPYVQHQIILGQNLRTAVGIAWLTETEAARYREKHYPLPGVCNLQPVVVREGDSIPDTARIMQYFNTTLPEHKPKGVALQVQYYGGNQVPLQKDGKKVKEFDELSGISKGKDGKDTKEIGMPRLGVLRMDVDFLGQIITKGLPLPSFSAYATLSGMLHLYFCGVLNHLRNTDTYRDDVLLLYSGGDDLFALGRWDVLVSFAEDVREGFSQFTGRADIGISGGMVLVDGKFPISKAAKMAEDAEKIAKELRRAQGDKNAFTWLDEPVSWQQWSQLKALTTEFLLANTAQHDTEKSEKPFTKGLLQKLQSYLLLQREQRPEWLWNALYTIARHKEQTVKKHTEHAEAFDQLTRLLLEQQYTDKGKSVAMPYPLLLVALRWAEYSMRLERKDEEYILT